MPSPRHSEAITVPLCWFIDSRSLGEKRKHGVALMDRKKAQTRYELKAKRTMTSGSECHEVLWKYQGSNEEIRSAMKRIIVKDVCEAGGDVETSIHFQRRGLTPPADWPRITFR